MARHEDQAEEIVPEVLVDGHVRASVIPLGAASELFVLALERFAAADQVGRAMLRGQHEPGARPPRHARRGPLLERSNEGVLCELLSRADVADEASQPGDEPGRLDPPDRLDSAMRLGGIYLGHIPSYWETCLISKIPPSKGARLSHSMASSIERTSHSQ